MWFRKKVLICGWTPGSFPKPASKDAAEQFLNYLCREDIGMENFDYVWYATPNTAVYDELDEEVQESTTIFSDQETLENCEIFNSLDVPATETYDYLWKKLKSY